MSVPSDQLMSMIRGQRGGAADTPTPSPDASPNAAPSDTSTPPMPSPMSTPEPKMGNREGALVNISMAMDLLEQALPALGSESPEGQKAMSALRSMSGILGPRKGKANELQQTEIMQLLQNLPQAGGVSPEARAMGSMPIVPGMANMGGPPPGAGGPPGAPPGMPPGMPPQQ